MQKTIDPRKDPRMIDTLDVSKLPKKIYRVRCGPDWYICDGRKDAIQRAEKIMQFRANCGLECYPATVTCETIIWVDGEDLCARRKGEQNNGRAEAVG